MKGRPSTNNLHDTNNLRIDPKSDVRGIKVPGQFTCMSCPRRVPSVSWDGIAQETTAISEGTRDSQRYAATRKARWGAF